MQADKIFLYQFIKYIFINATSLTIALAIAGIIGELFKSQISLFPFFYFLLFIFTLPIVDALLFYWIFAKKISQLSIILSFPILGLSFLLSLCIVAVTFQINEVALDIDQFNHLAFLVIGIIILSCFRFLDPQIRNNYYFKFTKLPNIETQIKNLLKTNTAAIVIFLTIVPSWSYITKSPKFLYPNEYESSYNVIYNIEPTNQLKNITIPTVNKNAEELVEVQIDYQTSQQEVELLENGTVFLKVVASLYNDSFLYTTYPSSTSEQSSTINFGQSLMRDSYNNWHKNNKFEILDIEKNETAIINFGKVPLVRHEENRIISDTYQKNKVNIYIKSIPSTIELSQINFWLNNRKTIPYKISVRANNKESELVKSIEIKRKVQRKH